MEWQNRREVAKQEAKRLQIEVGSAIEQGRVGDLFPFTGQTTGQIKDILPAAEIVHRLVNEAEVALKRISHLSK
ncbi:MAG: hypothetical protein WAM09_05020 [Anaerolineales bacterium]